MTGLINLIYKFTDTAVKLCGSYDDGLLLMNSPEHVIYMTVEGKEIPVTDNMLDIYPEIPLDRIIHVNIMLDTDYIPDCMFRNIYGLYSVNMENTQLRYTGEYSFQNCISLRHVTFPGTLTLIKQHAFNFTDIHILDFRKIPIATIEKSAFALCWHLTKVAFNRNVPLYIDTFGFAECFNLKYLYNYTYNVFPEDSGVFLLINCTPPGKYNEKFCQKAIINQKGCLKYGPYARHHFFMDKDDILFYGGGWYKIKGDTIILYSESDAVGPFDFSRLKYLPKGINHIIYNDEEICRGLPHED